MSELTWTKYEDVKPPEGRYWFRVDPSYYNRWGGRQVEFASLMRERGAGGQRVISPDFDHWDGYRVHVPRGIEWAPITDQEILDYKHPHSLDKEFFKVPDLDLKPCPFCGRAPKVDWHGRYITAPIWHVEMFSIRCCIAKIEFWRGDFDKLVERWNTRSGDCSEAA